MNDTNVVAAALVTVTVHHLEETYNDIDVRGEEVCLSDGKVTRLLRLESVK